MSALRTQEQADVTMRELVAYVSKYDPGFATCICGATQEEIGALESLISIPLPADYRAYLSYMGHDDAGLDIGQSASTKIEDVTVYYEGAATFPRENMVPSDCIMIAVDGSAVPNMALLLSEGREPAVVYAEDDRITAFLAASLPVELHRVVFIEHQLEALPQKCALHGPSGSHHSEEYRKEAAAFGFASQWFSDGVQYCGVRQDAVLGISLFRGSQVVVQIGANDTGEMERIAQKFLDQFGLSLSSAKRRSS